MWVFNFNWHQTHHAELVRQAEMERLARQTARPARPLALRLPWRFGPILAIFRCQPPERAQSPALCCA